VEFETFRYAQQHADAFRRAVRPVADRDRIQKPFARYGGLACGGDLEDEPARIAWVVVAACSTGAAWSATKASRFSSGDTAGSTGAFTRVAARGAGLARAAAFSTRRVHTAAGLPAAGFPASARFRAAARAVVVVLRVAGRGASSEGSGNDSQAEAETEPRFKSK
jgi:hypothetical protein